MQKFILALDQGTSSSRAILFDHDQRIIAVEQKETPQIFPQPAWVEQDANQIWHNQIEVAQGVLQKAGITGDAVAAIGITNQRETTIVWDKVSGKPVHNAIIWQDKRTMDFCNTLKENGYAGMIREKTGLVPDAYFSASKISWILQHIPEGTARAERGELLFGTVDSWLVWNLTGGRLHITDASNASRTMLYNIQKDEWDAELLTLFGVPLQMMPRVVNSSEIYGVTEAALFGGVQIPVAGIAGDQQAALFGQGCLSAGMAKNTYGTGCFLLMNTGDQQIISEAGLLTTVAWKLNGHLTYALEGSIFHTGSAVQWLKDQLKMIVSADETEALCIAAGSNGGVYMVPAFSGLGAPYWDMQAKGIITGITLSTGREQIVRAVIESIAYQTCDVLRAMESDSRIQLQALNVDGGATKNNFLMQFQSDILGVPVLRPEMIEATALGAAKLAGLGVQFWSEEMDLLPQKNIRRYEPVLTEKERSDLYALWQDAVRRAR